MDPSSGVSVKDIELILRRCDILAQITEEPGRITRGFLSDAMGEVNTQVAQWMNEAGLTTELDIAGNLIGSRTHGEEEAPLLVLGSHLDTVRDAGRYDGILGVLMAVAVAQAFQDEDLPFDLEIIGFSDEEGLRYGVPFLGSQALIGDLDPAVLSRRDEKGVPMADAISDWGGNPEAMCCRYKDRRLLGYVEAHIEQGPLLEYRDLSIGILEALSGSAWLNLRFEGHAGHAGTTPMELRRDPMPAAAELVLEAERLARDERDLVATVGKLEPRPGAGNVIPGEVELSLDMRHPDGRRLSTALDRLLEKGREVARQRDLTFTHEILHRQEGLQADPGLSQLLTQAAERHGADPVPLVIGAGHDALIMSRRMPVAMLFLRSPGGISHHPDESVRTQDVATAFATLQGFVRDLASREERREKELAWRLSASGSAVSDADALWDSNE